jgi:hypothetical protein
MKTRFLCTAALVCFIASPAFAFNFFELEVYPYQTEGKGVAELEWLQSIVPKGHTQAEEGAFATDSLYRSSFEVTYGLTEHIEAAAYLDIAHPNAHSLEYAGSRFRLRGSLFEKGELPIDLGWYAELEWQRVPEFADNELEVDLRPIVERDLGRFTLSLNPIFEKALAGPGHNKSFEFDYAAKVLYRWKPELSPSIEFYGDVGRITDTDPLRDQQHYIGPVIDTRLPSGFRFSVGPLFGLTRAADQILVKFNLEYEWFIGPA